MFNSTASSVYYLMGHYDDHVFTNGGELISHQEALHRLLKSEGYQRVILLVNNGENFEVVSYDAQSLESFIHSKKSATPQKKNSLFGSDSSKETNKEEDVKVRKVAKSPADLMALFRVQIKAALMDESTKTAIVFPYEIIQLMTDMPKNLNFLIDLINKRYHENVLIIELHNFNNLYSIVEATSNIFPSIGLNQHFDRKENDLKTFYKNQLKEALVIEGAIGRDEVRNMLEAFLLTNRYSLNYLEKKSYVDMIVHDLSEEAKNNRYCYVPRYDDQNQIVEKVVFSYDENKPLYSTYQMLFNYNRLTPEVRKLRFEDLKGQIDHYIEHSPYKEIQQMVGIDAFLDYIQSIENRVSKLSKSNQPITDVQLMRFNNRPSQLVLPADFYKSCNLMLFGPPGTGKTTLCRFLGEVLRELGVLQRGQTIMKSKQELKGQYVGQSLAKMNEAIEQAQESVLVIDEIETFSRGDASSENNEAGNFEKDILERILTAATDPNIHTVFVVSGYESGEEIIKSYEGLISRFPNKVILQNYSTDTLITIYNQWITKDHLVLDPVFRQGLDDFIFNWRHHEMTESKSEWANVRTLHNLYESMDQEVSPISIASFPKEVQKLYMPKKEYIQLVNNQLNELIGLKNAKNKVSALINQRILSNSQNSLGSSCYAFIGNPGTGKTTVAKVFGSILSVNDVLPVGKTIFFNVGDYAHDNKAIDHLKEAMKKASGGVLFIDEAYRLDPKYPGSTPYLSAINTYLLQDVEDNRGSHLTILAGYEHEMNSFIESNSGWASRISDNNTIHFDDYNADELVKIAELMSKKEQLTHDEGYMDAFHRLCEIEINKGDERFGNARFARSSLAKSKELMCNRLAKKYPDLTKVPKDEKTRLTVDDVDLPDSTVRSTTQNYHVSPVALRNMQAKYVDYTASNLIAEFNKAVLYLEVTKNNGDHGEGTGFIINENGIAVTCAHVAENTRSIRARLRVPGRIGGDDSYHDCTVLSVDHDLDLALIKLEGENFPALEICNRSYNAMVGEEYLIIGYPLGSSTSASTTTFTGKIASNDHQLHNGEVYYLDGSAMHGFSGSPVISTKTNQVIGVLNGAITGQSKEVDHITFSRKIKHIYDL